MRNEKAEVRYLQFVDAWYGLDAASARHFYPKAARLGLTRGQPRMLRFLGENDGCRQKDIAEKFYIRAASVSGILSTMEKEGLIERKVNKYFASIDGIVRLPASMMRTSTGCWN